MTLASIFGKYTNINEMIQQLQLKNAIKATCGVLTTRHGDQVNELKLNLPCKGGQLMYNNIFGNIEFKTICIEQIL